MRAAVTAVVGDFPRKPGHEKLIDEKPGNVGAPGDGEVVRARGHGIKIYDSRGPVLGAVDNERSGEREKHCYGG